MTYSFQADADDDFEPDGDVIHDAIWENFDTVDLEFTTEHPLYDEDDGELEDETQTINVNCDQVDSVEVVFNDAS